MSKIVDMRNSHWGRALYDAWKPMQEYRTPEGRQVVFLESLLICSPPLDIGDVVLKTMWNGEDWGWEIVEIAPLGNPGDAYNVKLEYAGHWVE